MTLANFFWIGAPALYHGRRMVVVGIDAPHLELHDGSRAIRVHISEAKVAGGGPVVVGEN